MNTGITTTFNVVVLAGLFFINTSMETHELEPHKQYVTMETIQAMCKDIHSKAVSDNFEPELLIGITRGGLMPLGFLAGETMFNNRNVRTISIASYSDEGEQSKLRFVSSFSEQELDYFRQFASILLIDDLADSGNTLDSVKQMLQENLPGVTIKTATLFYKKRSIITPDYYVEETDKWIVFPWEI